MSVTPTPYLPKLRNIPENTIGRTKAKKSPMNNWKTFVFRPKTFSVDKTTDNGTKNFPDWEQGSKPRF